MLDTLHAVRKKPLIVFLSLVAFSLLVISILPRTRKPNTRLITEDTTEDYFVPSETFGTLSDPNPNRSPAQSVTQPDSKNQILDTNNKAMLIASLPITTPDYSIEYSPGNQIFYILVYSDPQEEYYEIAKNHLKQFFPRLSAINLKSAFIPNP